MAVRPSATQVPSRLRPRRFAVVAGRGDLRRRAAGRAMVAPAILGLLVFTVYPLVYLIGLALTESSLGRPLQRWVGADNLRTVADDAIFRESLLRSVLFAVPVSVVELALGLGVALLLDAGVRRGSVARALILLPLMTPPITVAVAWKLLLAPEGGALNGIMQSAGLVSDPVSFLGTSPLAFLSIAATDVWQWTPFVAILAYAALQTVPEELHEAARVDGARSVERFWRITAPIILPSLLAILLLRLIMAFKVFDLVYGLTFGGPGFDTTMGTFEIFKTGLREFDVGQAAAQTIFFLVLVGLVILPMTILRERVLRGER